MPDHTWTRGEGPAYWKADLRRLTKLPDMSEPMSSVFRRLAHSHIGGDAQALARVSGLIEPGELEPDATVAEAIAADEFDATHRRFDRREDRIVGVRHRDKPRRRLATRDRATRVEAVSASKGWFCLNTYLPSLSSN